MTIPNSVALKTESMSDTPTAQQLWDQTDNYRREGGPGMPDGLKRPASPHSHDAFVNTVWNIDHAAAILRDHGRTWLEKELLFITTATRPDGACLVYAGAGKTVQAEGPTMLAAINAAIGAYLKAKEGK